MKCISWKPLVAVATALVLLPASVAAGRAAPPVQSRPTLPPVVTSSAPATVATSAFEAAVQTGRAAAAPIAILAHEYGYDAPNSVSSGTLSFSLQNDGAEYHMAQFLKLNDGVTADQLKGAVQAGVAADALALGTPSGGANAIEPGDTQDLTLSLTPGNYVMLCFVYSDDGIPHAVKGMVHQFSVTQEHGQQATPSADLTVAAQDYSFQVPQISPGQKTIQFVNQGTQAHEMALLKLTPGTTPDQAQQSLSENPSQEAQQPDAAGGIAGIAAGTSAWATVDFTPGVYMLICYMQDSDTALPHAVLGMSQLFVVSDQPPPDQGGAAAAAP